MPIPSLSSRVAARYKDKKEVPKAKGPGTTTVYEYSERQVSNRNRAKAERVEKLRQKLDKLRQRYRKDLTSDDPKKRLSALAVALIDLTYERVGNEGSAKDSGHYGVTTWEANHVKIKDGKATIAYTGKSGVKHEKVVSDSKVVSALKKALKGKSKGDQILCDGDDCKVKAADVNSYLKEFDVTAKDLRGLHANEEMRSALQEVRKAGPKLPDDRKEKDKILKEEFKKALEKAAEAVGHEASTLKNQYLVPGLEDSYLKDGTVMDKLTKTSATLRSRRRASDEEVFRLWKLLDNIDTAGDIAKGDDAMYRNLVERYQAQRWDVVPEERVDGLYDTYFTWEKEARVDLPRGRWVDARPSALDEEEKDVLWELYSTSYGKIGLHIPSLSALLQKYQVLRLVNVDDDVEMDAFIAYKKTPFGKKFGIMGTDGSSAAKRTVIQETVRLLKSSGWYVEASHKFADIIESAGVPRILDEGVVREVLQGKEIDWLGDGYYTRQLGSMGSVRKALYGHPKGVRTSASLRATKSENEVEEEEAQRLVRRSPKLKPPRTDLERGRMQQRDDKEDDPDQKQDKKDRSHNYKDSSSRVALRHYFAKVARHYFAKVTQTETGKWRAERPDSEVPQYFDDQGEAEAWAKGGEGSGEDPKGGDLAKGQEDLAQEYEGKGLSKEKVKEILSGVEKPEDLASAKELLDEAAQSEATSKVKGEVTQAAAGLSGSAKKSLLEGIDNLDADQVQKLSEALASAREDLGRKGPGDLDKFVAEVEKARGNLPEDPEELGRTLAAIDHFDNVIDNPLVQVDPKIGEIPSGERASKPLGEKDVQKARKATVDRTEGAVVKYRDLDKETRERHASKLDAEILTLPENSERRLHLEAVNKGIAMASAIEDGSEATGVGASLSRLVKAADKGGNLRKLMEISSANSTEARSGDDQAVVRSVYEDLTENEWSEVLPDDHPAKELADLLADPDNLLTDDDIAAYKAILTDVMVGEVSFLDPYANRELDPGATVADKEGVAKKLRSRATGEKSLKDLLAEGKSGGVVDWLQEFLKGLSGLSNKGKLPGLPSPAPAKKGSSSWDFAPWPKLTTAFSR